MWLKTISHCGNMSHMINSSNRKLMLVMIHSETAALELSPLILDVYGCAFKQ